MTFTPTLVERAYALARSGGYSDVQELARQLKVEKFDSVDSHLSAPGLRKTLAVMCKQARAEDAGLRP